MDVDVSGVVTYFDGDAGVLYLQDGSGAAALEIGDVGARVSAGDSVRVTGALVVEARAPRLAHGRVTVLGQSRPELMPAARALGVDDLLARRGEGEWVEVEGIVRAARESPGRLRLELREHGRRFEAEIERGDPNPYDWLVDFRVSIRGVSPSRSRAGRGEPADLLVPEIGYVRLLEDSPADAFALPVTSVDRLWRTAEAALPAHRVHARGRVASAGDGRLVVVADGRACGVWTAAPTNVPPGTEVDLVGFPTAGSGTVWFEQAVIRPHAQVASRAATGPTLPLLTTADQVRRLEPAEARKGYPIRLEATVTYNDPDMRLLFVQDRTGGIYVEAWRHVHHLRPGDRVAIEGRSAPGAFAPIVDYPRVRVVGHGPLPVARRVRPEDLVSGQADSQWLEVEGVVHGVSLRRPGAVIRMAAGGARFPVEVAHVGDAGLASRLVDARVRVRAVCQSVLTLRGQLADISLHAPDLDALTVLTPPPLDPFSAPVRQIRSLLQFVPGQSWERRVRVEGVVTYSQPGRLYVTDATGGLAVYTADAPPPAIGDRIDAVGFATAGEYTPVLQDAEARTREPGTVPEPRAITPEQAMSGEYDSELVTIDARLLDTGGSRDLQQLSLQQGPYLFAASLSDGAGAPLPRAGSTLRLTGICVVRTGEYRVPQTFRLLLRSARDVRVLRPAPWWTGEHAAWLLAGMVGLVGAALAWVGTLRRRVRAQSAIIWRRVRRETELQERHRMARELHDTLEQNLTGISLSLEAASLTLDRAPTMAGQHLTRALGQVEASMNEVHRAVWGLRDDALAGGLAGALDDIGRQLASCSATPIEVRTTVAGQPRPFALAVENNLLRIGQEALTNAVKHGHAPHVEVRLGYEAHSFRLEVRDDGRGFDPGAAAASGRFGLIGMRERAHEIGARLEVRSAMGGGTAVAVTVPLEPLTLSQAG